VQQTSCGAAAQNPAQSVHADSRTDSHDESKTAAPLAFAGNAAVPVPPRGVEQPPDPGRETANPPAHGTESGTPAADPLPELLALVVELPPEAAALLLTIARRLRPS